MAGPANVPLSRWRENVVDALIWFYLVAQAFAMGASVLRQAPHMGPIYGVWATALAVTSVLGVARRLPLELRVVGVVAASSVSALSAVMWTGLVAPSAAVLIGASGVLLAVGVGRAAAFTYLALMAAALLTVGGLIVSRTIAPVLDFDAWFGPFEMKNWVRQAFSVTLLASVLALAAHLVVSRIEREMAVRRAEGEEHGRCSAALLELATDRVVESGDLAAAFAAITRSGARGLEVRRASIWMLENGGTRLRCKSLFDGTRSDGGDVVIDVEHYSAYFSALAAGRCVAAEDVHTDPATHQLASGHLDALGIASMLDAPIRHQDSIVGVVCLEHVGSARPWSVEAQGFAGSLADFAARALSAAKRTHKEIELQEAYELLGRLHRRVENAKEEERRHLARELHDELGQVLTALKLRLQLAARAGAVSGGGAPLDDSVSLVDGLIAQVRKLSVDLTPALLVEAGIAPAIHAYLEGHVALAGISFDFDREGLDERLPSELEIAAFRVVQEALTNVIRHAGAHHVSVSTSRTVDALCLGVRDDGRGFDVQQASHGARTGSHFGLASMRERVKGLGGTFELRSSSGSGTEVRVTLPLSPPPGIG